MPSTLMLGTPRRSGAPGLLPFRRAVLKGSTHARQVQIAASRFSLPRRNEMSPTWRVAERRRPPGPPSRAGSPPQDDLATGITLTLRTQDHTSVEEGRTAGDKLPPGRETRVPPTRHADRTSA